MIVRVLGTLDVRINGCSVVPTATKPRKVLALLALNANHVLPASALMRELWGDEPPASAATTLQTYILSLRKKFAVALDGGKEEAKRQLATCPGGYRLRLPSGVLDLHQFEERCIAGRQALATGDNRAAAQHLGEALAMWRDDALVDVAVGPLLEVEAVRLREVRLGALEQRLEAHLRMGRHHEVLGELAALTVQFPLNENLHAQQMLALYRSGRRAQALGVYHRLRHAFVEELGLDLSARMRELHRAVLESDPALDSGSYQHPLLLDNFDGCLAAS